MFKKKTQDTTNQRKRSTDLSKRSKSYSYYESRSNREGNRKRADDLRQNDVSKLIKRRPWYIQTLNTFILILVLVFIGYDLVLSQTPKLVIEGNNSTTSLFSVSRSKYQAAADALFKNSITSRTKITISTHAIVSKLEKEFPELANVSVSLPLVGNQPTITVIPAQPALIVTSQGQSGSFLVATNGRVLASSISAWPKNTLPKVIDETGIEYVVGQTPMSPTDISFMEIVANQLSAKNIIIASMTLPSQSRELDVYIAGEPYYIRFNLEDYNDAAQQIGTYLATREYLTNNQITPSDYIDAMVVGRVFYK